MQAPQINVTPLIDVLLVLLIIFMVISPMKPASFTAAVPKEETKGQPNPLSIVVTVAADNRLSINKDGGFGTVDEPAMLVKELERIFTERAANRVYSQGSRMDAEPLNDGDIERTVFIKAPKDLPYGSVVKIVDAVKLAGSDPISLQIDRLN
jgi:biopolymer transport protein ExbD